MMQLQVMLPTEILVDAQTKKIVAEAENGSFCLLPRHVNFVTALAPGLLSYTDSNDTEHFLGVAEGVLVKVGHNVMISVEFGARGENLGQLRSAVRHYFEHIDDRERQAISAVARLEADFVRRFLALEERPHVG